jgi:hypothetical protein
MKGPAKYTYCISHCKASSSLLPFNSKNARALGRERAGFMLAPEIEFLTKQMCYKFPQAGISLAYPANALTVMDIPIASEAKWFVAPSAASDRTARQRIIVKTASVVKH